MARAIWSGAITFGLLNVPVKLYSAVSKQTIRFRELREDDGSRIRHKRIAEEDGEEVPYEKIVKGYEISPDQYVILSRDELAEIDPEKTRAIGIQDFVDLDEIDPIFFEQPYYLGPARGAERAYALLVRAMEDSRKVAIARFVLRNKEHLAAIRAADGALTMATMRFHDEVVAPENVDGVVPADAPEPDERELEMARRLIDSLSSAFEPERYEDEYRDKLLALIERKARGEAVVTAPAEEPKPTKAPDLMAALEESLAAVRSEELGRGNGGGKAREAGASAKSRSGSSKARSGSSKARSGSSKARSGSSKARSTRTKSRSGTSKSGS